MSKKHRKKFNRDGRGRFAPSAPSLIIPADRIFYWAYGSNLSVRQMKSRCPKAIKHGPMNVHGAALVFRYYADVTVRENSLVPGGLWQITADCERELDLYEGVATKNYLKRYFHLRIEGRGYTCLFYQMRASRGILPPSERYIDTIAEGYADFGLDLNLLDAYLQEAWGTKDPTPALMDKYQKRGRPRLAKALSSPDTPGEPARISRRLMLPPPMWNGRE